MTDAALVTPQSLPGAGSRSPRRALHRSPGPFVAADRATSWMRKPSSAKSAPSTPIAASTSTRTRSFCSSMAARSMVSPASMAASSEAISARKAVALASPAVSTRPISAATAPSRSLASSGAFRRSALRIHYCTPHRHLGAITREYRR
jgi:hypothetical protein